MPGQAGVPRFSRGLWRIASANVSSGNQVRLLHDRPETFDAMTALIDGAAESVALESYIFRSDEVGMRFAMALGAAAARGVSVRVVVEGPVAMARYGAPRRGYSREVTMRSKLVAR